MNRRTPIEHGDILFTSVGSYGNAAIVKDNTKFAFQRHIAYIKPDKLKIDPFFLFGAMKSNFIIKQVDKVVRGVAQQTLNLSDLRKLEIPNPPRNIQNKFTVILKQIEAIKLQYQQSHTELKNLYCGLSNWAFNGELDLRSMPVNSEIKDIAGK